MRYPVLTSSDANTILQARREGGEVDSEAMIRYRGEGQDLDTAFVSSVRAGLDEVRKKFPVQLKRNSAEGNRFEAEAASIIHRLVPQYVEALADPDYWSWLAVLHFSELIEWRYGNQEGGTSVLNYGVSARGENLIYRLWLRADLAFDETAKDPYHLVAAGQVDFWRSHMFRQGYSNARDFARALLKFQYPYSDPTAPKLKINEIRELVKRLRRLRSNLFLELLDESECLDVIENEAGVIATT